MLALNFGESDCFLRFLREASGPVDPLLGAGLFTLPFNGACNAIIFLGFYRLSTTVDKIVCNSTAFSACKTTS